jgi:DNA-binding NarL/FixJ family response regulator
MQLLHRPAQKIRLLLVDDHSLFREGLKRLLEAEPEFELAGDCATASAALAALNSLQVDVVLLDYDLGEQTGIYFLEQVRRMQFPGRILMVTAGLSDADTLRILKLGASGIFLKHSPPVELINAIRKVIAGETWLDSRSVDAILTAAHAAAQPPPGASPLTSREKDVLKAVFEGLSNKEIGARLDISETYVKALLQQLFNKTGVRSRSQLVRIALERPAHYGIDLNS